MSNVALKRTTVVLIVLTGMLVTLLMSLVTTHYEGAYASDEATTSMSKMVPVSDRPYKTPVGIGITSKKATPEVIAELEEAAAAPVGEVAISGEIVVEPDTDWQTEEVSCVYDEVAYYDPGDVAGDSDNTVGQGWYDDVASSYNIASYVEGSGYYDANVDGAWYEGSEFVSDGRYKDGSGMEYTWYPESVLPGGGLDIPGRHVGEEGYVCDENGNVCLASDYLPQGTVVNIPFGGGTGVVYDSGCGYDVLDVYVSW